MISMLSLGLMAQLAIIPADMQSSIDKALATEDKFIIKAVISQAVEENPGYKQDIKEYVLEKTTPEKVEELSPAAGIANAATGFTDFWTEGWDGQLEGGLLVQTGNSKSENLNGAAKLTKETQNWEHILQVSAVNNSSDGVRSAEEYRAGLQSRNNISATDYIFGEVDWVKDRYSGFDYRISELLGYGHKYFDTDELKLSSEAAIGMQQSKRTGSSSENNFIQKIAGDLEWAINDNLTFTQHLSTEHADSTFFSLSQTALKTKISDSLALKVGYDMEHISKVPAGTKKLDTKTMVNVLYDF